MPKYKYIYLVQTLNSFTKTIEINYCYDKVYERCCCVIIKKSYNASKAFSKCTFKLDSASWKIIVS